MLRIICGVLLGLSAVWTFLLAFPTYNALKAVRNADGYHEAEFVVSRLVYYEEPDGLDQWWAEGVVDGNNERYSLQGQLPNTPRSIGDLQSMVKAGDRFRVLYNPEMSAVMVQGETLRVMPWTATLRADRMRLLRFFVYSSLVPLIALSTAFVVLSVIARASKPRAN